MAVDVVRQTPIPVENPVEEVKLKNPIIPASTCVVRKWMSGGLYFEKVYVNGKRLSPNWDMVIEGEKDTVAFIKALTELARQQGYSI